TLGARGGRRHGVHPLAPALAGRAATRAPHDRGGHPHRDGHRDRARHAHGTDRQRRLRRAHRRRAQSPVPHPDRRWCGALGRAGDHRRRPARARRTGPHPVAPEDRDMSVLADTWEFLTTADSWTGRRGILARGQAHVWISVVATTIAAAIAIPSAILLAHRRWLPIMSVAVINIGRAIPSFAIIALLFPLSIQYGFGLGFWPTCVALIALGVPPMFTNTYAGIAGTPPELVEAGRGIGMTGGELLRKV